MTDRFNITDMPEALGARRFPTVTTWNRLEGRPRTVNFTRALRTEIRDALWMLTRQWQVGEFSGEDAGSPVFAKVHVATSKLTRFRAGAGPAVDFRDDIPLETQVEQLPWRTRIGRDKVSLDLRLMAGRRWLRHLAGIGNYGALFAGKYKFDLPDPTQASDAAVCADPEVWQGFAAVAGRAVDGISLYEYLKGGSGRHAYDGLAVLDIHKPALDDASRSFVSWVDRLISRPSAPDNPAWRASRFEYRFACSAPVASGEKVYVADEYHHGTLDWHSLDVDPSLPSLEPPDAGAGAADPRKSVTRTMIPVPLTYAGMPQPRWWGIEDRRTNFGEITPDTTDLAKLLFIEFGLVYSNDWFIIPLTLESGTLVSLRGLMVTTVFGERIWVTAAGSGQDEDWQRWSMYTHSTRGKGRNADTDLLLLPTVPKVQEGRPLEQVVLMRDEMANMVWAIEKTIPAPDGDGRSGASSARATRAYLERLVAAAGSAGPALIHENEAKIRYDIMSSVPENWIPLIPVRADGGGRAIELQRAALPRIIEGDTAPPVRVRPRTSLLRVGLDQSSPQPFFVPEEEVPRAGAIVSLGYQRTRWLDGSVFVWSGARKVTGRGEGSSGLAFDRLVDVKPLRP